MKRRAQTATEYLVILAVVIVIALIVVGVMGGIPSIGGGASASAAKAALASQKIAITNFAVSDYDTDLMIQNNHNSRVEIDTISLNGEECLFFMGTKHVFGVGQKKTITCQNVYEVDQDKVNWLIEINWTDLSTGASYTQSGSDLALVGAVANEYLSTVQSNSYWNGVDGCYDNSTSNNPICTCVDLNKTRLNLDKNHTMQNSIDFIRCNNEFGVDFRSGSGWEPIGTFTASFDGSQNIIANLFIFRSAHYQGLFGQTSGSNIYDIGVVDVDVNVTGSSYYQTGGLVGTNTDGSVSNSFSTGSVAGDQIVGGLIGDIRGTSSVSNSFSMSSVNGVYAGGLIGASYNSGSVSNSYAASDVTGSYTLGGLVGYFNSASISNSYWVNTSQNPDNCYSSGNDGCTAVSSINEIPIR